MRYLGVTALCYIILQAIYFSLSNTQIAISVNNQPLRSNTFAEVLLTSLVVSLNSAVLKRIIFFIGLLSVFSLFTECARAQAPNITYSPSTSALLVGTPFSIAPTNTGGAVPANGYGQVTTIAGSTAGTSGFVNANGTGARFNLPQNSVNDAAGNIYVADYNNNVIRKISTSGAVTTYAGNGTAGLINNAVATLAEFNGPEGIDIDGAGNIYVGDFNNNAIRKITPAGVVSTFATGTNGPAGIRFDGTGNLYVAEQNGNQISKISSTGVRTVFAGSGATGRANNLNKLAATFNAPLDVQPDGAGNFFVADALNNEIREITAAGAVTLFAGSPAGTAGLTNGTGTAALFNAPTGIAKDAIGNFYIADNYSNEIRMMTSAGVVTLLAGSSTGTTGTADGTLTAAAFNEPNDLYIDANDVAYIVDAVNNSIRKMYLTGYAISPAALPAGLSFDATTGIISGTPTAAFGSTVYTITAYNITGKSSTTVTLSCTAPTINNWKGGTAAWATGTNWSLNHAPLATETAQIGVVAYTGASQPTLAGNTTVKSIVFGTKNSPALTINSGITLTVTNGLGVNAASTAIINGPGTISLAGGSFITAGGTLTLSLNAIVSLAASSQIVNYGTLTLGSDANGSSSFSTIPATSSVSGTISVQRYLKGGALTYRGYRLLSSPVYASTVGGNNVYSINYLKNSIFLTATTTGGSGGFDNTAAANPTLYLYRENLTPSYTTFTGSNFRGINNINSSPVYTLDVDGSGFSIPAGNGYLCFFRGDRNATGQTFTTETVTSYVPQSVTLTATGTLNQGHIIVKDWFTPSSSNLSYTAASPITVKGFNLVGNPYPSSINWDTFQSMTPGSTIYGQNISTSIYVLDPISHNYGAYIAGNGGIGGTNNATNIIASGQGFFVITSATTATLTFDETAKTTTQVTGSSLLMGSPVNVSNNQYLKLRLAKDSVNTDETVIRFNSNGSTNFNPGLDAPYKGGYGSVSLSGISNDHVSLAIDVIPLPHAQPESVSLNVTANTDGAYTISLKDLVSVPQLYDLWLIDKYKKDTTNLRQNSSYTFNIAKADTASYGANRFKLVIGQNPAFACQLLSFTGSKMQGSRQVQLVWNTQNEGNYTNYTVERSIDGGKTFAVLGAVPTTGSGKYSLQDQNPINGSNLYRLKQVDVNNVITYSNVVTIAYSDLSNNLANNLMLFPNPAVNTLSLNLVTPPANNLSSYNIRFMNSSGLIIKQVTSAQPSWQGSINNLQPGTYIVQVLNSSTSSLVGQGKFVKL